mmetsp:Transcript_12445/g.11027  ORF Transcript_12445/g.11027 Transcript_12445/m.11027 type:complete len:130 (+) Transcript_12445:181-570(+)
MAVYSLICVFCNDPGFVPKNLKIQRPELFEYVKAQAGREIEEMKLYAQLHASKRTKNNELEMSNLTTDLESQTLVKTNENEKEIETDTKSKKGKKKGKRISMREKMTRFNYCPECDNIQPPRTVHCSLC